MSKTNSNSPISNEGRKLPSDIISLSEIISISEMLINKKRWRDFAIFSIGINLGINLERLRVLKYTDILTSNKTIKKDILFYETQPRGGIRKTEYRIAINSPVKQALRYYMSSMPTINLNDYLFSGESNRSIKGSSLDRASIYRIIKSAGDDAGIRVSISPKTLRKSFLYYQVLAADSVSKVKLLCNATGHGTYIDLLAYLGFTEDEISSARKQIEFDSKAKQYFSLSKIVELM